MNGGWPAPGQWEEPRAADRVAEHAPPARMTAEDGAVRLEFELPMPGVSFVEFAP